MALYLYFFAIYTVRLNEFHEGEVYDPKKGIWTGRGHLSMGATFG